MAIVLFWSLNMFFAEMSRISICCKGLFINHVYWFSNFLTRPCVYQKLTDFVWTNWSPCIMSRPPHLCNTRGSRTTRTTPKGYLKKNTWRSLVVIVVISYLSQVKLNLNKVCFTSSSFGPCETKITTSSSIIHSDSKTG